MAKEYLINIVTKYGGFIIGGLIGAVVHRLRNKASIKKFLGTLFISSFTGFCVGVLMKYFIKVPDEIIFVSCSISGVFSKDFLDEAQKIISFTALFVKKKAKIDEK